MKKIITINIGNKGAVLSVKDKHKIFNKIFIEEFNQASFPSVSSFFNKYKTLDVYIILDTVAQNYNYKIFPPLNYFDLHKIVNRRFNSEIPKSDLKQKKFLYKNSLDKRSVFLFVSASVDSPLKEWLNFLKTTPNNLLGVYMLPLESVDFAKAILKSLGMKEQLKEKNKWILITFNDQTSDLRQIAIFNKHIAFTRLISLDSAGDNLSEFAKNDIIRTSEYIKRFDNDFDFNKLTILTILDQKNREALVDLKIEKSIVLNFTPYEISKSLNLGSGSIEKEEKFADLLLTLFIFKNFHRLRFGNTRINALHNIVSSLNILKTGVAILIFSIIACFLLYTSISTLYSGKINSVNRSIEKNKKLLQSQSKDEFGLDSEEVDKIISAGTLKDMLNKKYLDPIDNFQKLFTAQNELALTHQIKWIMKDFDYSKPSINNIAEITYDITILNPDGDPNKLFSRYDSLNLKLKEVFKSEITKITSMPNSINFSKKYFTYPIKLEITERK